MRPVWKRRRKTIRKAAHRRVIAALCICVVLPLGLIALNLAYSGVYHAISQIRNEALFAAIENRDVAAAEQALQNGADIHALAYPQKAGLLGEFVYYNHTPLIRACRMDDIAMVELLIDEGADVNLADPWVNRTPLEWTLGNTHTENNANRFAIARLLIDHGAEIDVGTGIWTPMNCVDWTYASDSAATLQQGRELKEYMRQTAAQE